MKRFFFATVFAVLGFAFISGCATMPVYERKTETRMIVTQEKIEEGTQAGLIDPDQSRMYLSTLKDIRTDYAGMLGKKISGEERDRFQGRLDTLAKLVDRALVPAKKSDEPEDTFWERFARDMGFIPNPNKPRKPTNGERIVYLQKKIDDGRNSGAFSLTKGEEFQAKMDYIRKEYLRMMDGDKIPTIDERTVISRLLSTLEADLSLIPRL